MKWDFRHHLILQIEMLRGDISHEEFSKRSGTLTERSLARYVAGKAHLHEGEFRLIAKALSIDPQTLARAWASSLGLRVSETDAVSQMVERAYCQWNQHSRISGVPSNPSPMAIIRARYADRLPRKTPPLWLGAHFHNRTRKDTPENRARFARAYEMLVDSVHGGLSSRDIGALHGISGERARQLMVFAAYTWAGSERIDLTDKSVPFKNEARFVKNLYAGLRFFAQQQFNELAAQTQTNRPAAGEDWTSMKKQTDIAALERYRQEHDRCLGVAVCELRTNRGLTQSELAKRAQVSVLWIQRLETNQLSTNYTIRRLDQVVRALGVELFDLYKRAGEMMGPPPWLEEEGIGTQNDE